ncbi:MAG TPA: hypothetical protein VKZ53_27160 [Candidatus Angelobacter sp.]|nr:hypothetical protein [Candidatus Angelobacter sp.]
MANVITVKRVQNLERDKSIRYQVALSGNYVQVANGGEVLAINSAQNPQFLPGAGWGLTGPDVTKFGVGYPLQGPGGLAAEIVPGVDAFHPILKLFNTTTGTELAAGAYPAAVIADTNFFIQLEGRNID